MKTNYQILMSAGQDAANNRMKKDGRTKWNKADFNKACDTFYKLVEASMGQHD